MNIAAPYPTQRIPPKTLYYRVIGQSVLLLELDRGQISAISAVPEKPEGAAILLYCHVVPEVHHIQLQYYIIR